MKLLVDSALPTSLDGLVRGDVELARYEGLDVSDAGLVDRAAGLHCDGLVFMGRRILGQRGLLEVANGAGLLCVVVNEDEPNRAGEHLIANLELIERRAQTTQVLIVLAREVEAIPWPEAD